MLFIFLGIKKLWEDNIYFILFFLPIKLWMKFQKKTVSQFKVLLCIKMKLKKINLGQS